MSIFLNTRNLDQTKVSTNETEYGCNLLNIQKSIHTVWSCPVPYWRNKQNHLEINSKDYEH